MRARTQDLLFAACGVASVVVLLAGVGIGATGNRQFVTISSTSAQISKALATPADTAAWAGAYLELLSFGLFIAFAIWACAKLGGGLLGAVAGAAATGYATLSLVSLCLMDAIAYRSGHGIPLQLGTALVTFNEALFVGTWFLSAFFLLAAGALALTSSRRVLGWSAIATGALTLVLAAVSPDNLGQVANALWLIWVVAASITLARGQAAPTRAFPVAQHA